MSDIETQRVMNMLLLCGEEECDGKEGAERLRALIDGLIHAKRDAARYRARRWHAYADGRSGVDGHEYTAFAAQYDAVSDAGLLPEDVMRHNDTVESK